MGMLEDAAGSALFQGMPEEETRKVLRCVGSVPANYEKGESIVRSGDPFPKAGLLLRGSALLCCEEATGERLILSTLAPGEMFGLSTSICGIPMEYSVCAGEDCHVLIMDARKLINGCEAACPTHQQLLRNIIGMLSQKNLLITRKMYHVSQRSLRRKILSFLSEQAELYGQDRFTILMNRQEMADYLAADRSALSAELSRLKKEGIIDYQKNSFVLFNREAVYAESR